MDFDDLTESIMLAAVAMRGTLLEYIADRSADHPPRPGVPATTGFCNGAAYGLLLHLREEEPEVSWRVASGRGGKPEALAALGAADRARVEAVVDLGRWPGGMLTPEGDWRDHWWVAGTMPDGTELIVDLTADQFGYGTVIVEPGVDPRYRANLRPGRENDGLSLAEISWGIGLEMAHARFKAGTMRM
jgi:hypothetical protein